jgi:hypothetical protein
LTPSFCALIARTREVQIPVVRDPNFWLGGSSCAAFFETRVDYSVLPPFASGPAGRCIHFIFLAIEICSQISCLSIELNMPNAIKIVPTMFSCYETEGDTRSSICLRLPLLEHLHVVVSHGTCCERNCKLGDAPLRRIDIPSALQYSRKVVI